MDKEDWTPGAGAHDWDPVSGDSSMSADYRQPHRVSWPTKFHFGEAVASAWTNIPPGGPVFVLDSVSGLAKHHGPVPSWAQIAGRASSRLPSLDTRGALGGQVPTWRCRNCGAVVVGPGTPERRDAYTFTPAAHSYMPVRLSGIPSCHDVVALSVIRS